MPSPLHEVLVEIFRTRPSLAPTLLRDALGVPVPPHDQVRVESAELGDVVPPEYRADLVVVLVEDREAVVLALAIEVQLRAAPRKRLTWPVYATSLRARHDCDAAVLVIAPEAEVAAWAEAPIAIGPGGSSVRPLVLGPAQVPIVIDEAFARANPELALLSGATRSRSRSRWPRRRCSRRPRSTRSDRDSTLI